MSDDRPTEPDRSDATGAGEESQPLWIDAHCHLDMVESAAEVLERLGRSEVIGVVTVGTDADSSRVALDIARSHEAVWCTAGLHPHDASNGPEWLREFLADALGNSEPLVAVGECGLDYHYDNSPRDVQRRVFAEQIGLAHEFGLPLVVHTRDAWQDTLDILDSETVPDRTVIHCFTGGPEEASRCLERGAFLSMSGIVTFRSADDIREAVRLTPLDRLMVETDSPFLTPVPHRGRPNTPLFVPFVGAALAELKEIPVDEMARVSTATTRRFYGLDTDPGSDPGPRTPLP